MDPFEAGLYPGILAAGGLATAVDAVARGEGLDLGRVHSQPTSQSGPFTSAKVDSSRGVITVSLGDRRRAFFVGIHERRFTWAEGDTDDLEAVVRAVAAWRDGMPVGDFAENYPFMTPGRLARARESGDQVLVQWNWIRNAEVYAEEHSLVDAVHADGRFGHLFPNLSHGTLRLSKNYGVQGSREIHIWPVGDSGYGVEDTALVNSGIIATSLGEALDVAAGILRRD